MTQDEVQNPTRPTPVSFRILPETKSRLSNLQNLAGMGAEQLLAMAASLLEDKLLGQKEALQETNPLRELFRSFEAWNGRLIQSLRQEVDRLSERAVVMIAMENKVREDTASAAKSLEDAATDIAREMENARQHVASEYSLRFASQDTEIQSLTTSLDAQRVESEALQQNNYNLNKQLTETKEESVRLVEQLRRTEKENVSLHESSSESIHLKRENVLLAHQIELLQQRLEAREREIETMIRQHQHSVEIIKMLSQRAFSHFADFQEPTDVHADQASVHQSMSHGAEPGMAAPPP